MTKETLKIDFADFWTGFNKTDNFFYKLLSVKYNVQINNKPDLLFFSVWGDKHKTYNCTKVFYTGENVRPDFYACDYAFSFDYSDHPRNYRLPLYVLYGDMNQLVNREIDPDEILSQKSKFCCFLVSNDRCQVRNDFFKELSRYKQVDSGGQTLNNLGYMVANKMEFIKDYKFVIAFENESFPGYTTEKIYEPLAAHCIPIYWGDPLVNKDFNSRAFVNCHEFSSFEDAIAQVKLIDNDDELYKQYLTQPAFNNDQLPELVKNAAIELQLDNIVAFHIAQKEWLKASIRPIYYKTRDSLLTVKQGLLKLSRLPFVIVKRLLNKK